MQPKLILDEQRVLQALQFASTHLNLLTPASVSLAAQVPLMRTRAALARLEGKGTVQSVIAPRGGAGWIRYRISK